MPSPLPPSAYVVLGLLGQRSSLTPYQLDKRIRESIGHFWAFPRSQLYAEAGRLIRRGLIAEQRETEGRRRRTLSLTDAGRTELDRWLDTPSASSTEIHDEGLLRLFFLRTDGDCTDAIVSLATEQLEAHRRQLAHYQDLVAARGLPPGSPQRATLELGLRMEQMFIAFWTEAVASPDDLPGRD
ncbi:MULTISPECIES: PadR family transcriptional regulator [Actinoplanes]|uniref:PadR family transcriptional regulator n=1 Tax=Actinoplanes TaxID=1865 RepID=UPI0005F27E73|nr:MULTISPECIES: PadR family transcriptional regulator [Actinoplanes]GLY02462.1 hypothetical protein Acsp01_28410 [Actinoplanes sp. NBRC 101535]